MFKAKEIDIDASHELIVLLRKEDADELSLKPCDRIKISCSKNKKSLVCELEIVEHKKNSSCPLKVGEVGLFESAFEKLTIWENMQVKIAPAPRPKSLDYVKEKFEGSRLNEIKFTEIIQDIVNNRYSEVETTYFVLSCSVNQLNEKEIAGLTKAMVKCGKILKFKNNKKNMILDKHCIGGVAGNRTTMVVIPIIAAAGYTIAKTSSRAITSASGTADTMEVVAEVDLNLSDMHRVVEQTNSCMLWGGGLDLSPADDIIIKVEHPLRLDSEGQMIASILSKKKSSGSTHVLIDIPVGKEAKIISQEHAEKLAKKFQKIGSQLDMKINTIITDGSEPIGNGIGPRLEALDVVSVLKNEDSAPDNLREKSLFMAGLMLEMAGEVKKGKGYSLAKTILESGMAYEKFESIRNAQGRKEIVDEAKFSYELKSEKSGRVVEISNKKIAKIAFVLGAPKDHAAGVYIEKKVGNIVKKNENLLRLYTNSNLKLKYAKHILEDENIFSIQK